MSHLVAYFDESPRKTSRSLEVQQLPISQAHGLRSVDGPARPDLVYVVVYAEIGPFLVPFGEYDDWALRDKYNEAIRIMNTLGAAEIVCETFGETVVKRGVRARFKAANGEFSAKRIENSGFDFRHTGTGGEARDPRPLRWPDEPGFAAAVSSVLDNGATEVVINIRSNKNFAVDGSLGVQLKNIGFDLGGVASTKGEVTLHIKATFPRPQKGWW